MIRLSHRFNRELLQLAAKNFQLWQSIYRNALEELQSWSKEWSLSTIGFGREKTTYCCYAIASNSSVPLDSDVRMVIAKSAVIVTVADDFFDMEGSLDELETLTEAVFRGRSLRGHGRVIFDALDNLVNEVAAKYADRQRGSIILNYLRQIWYQTFDSWLTEAKWSKEQIPVHALVLPASCFMAPALLKHLMRCPTPYLTELLMISSRLLNEIQSYKKEKEDGKMNLVLLYLKENPDNSVTSR
uniref:Terpene synthase metal-binding domain-containing protein n=1 Tax=Nelumbo nucifera TaxID=4432 RepID=A0A822XV69_NELNU|nr:TPA_asm: hypothetical protein HUJ06_024452 [Nelumbo nucifera]